MDKSRLLLLVIIVLGCLYSSPGITLDTQAQDELDVQTIQIDGLEEPVSIFRDEWGVPTIKATGDHDLFFGYGYSVASDRLWQMDGSRRLARGQIAEVAGQSQLHWDIYHRNLGLGRAADESVELLDPLTHEYLQAFSDGVNAYIESHLNSLSFEFLLMDYQPEPWTVSDCLAVTRLVAVWLAADSWDEEMYGTLIDEMGEEVASKMFPPSPRLEPEYIMDPVEFENTEVDRVEPVTDDREVEGQPFDESPGYFSSGGDFQGEWIRQELISGWLEPLAGISSGGHLNASNIWAVDGSMTESGEPILAMDPHLNYFAPSILYEVVLDGEEFNCWGVTFPGMPFPPFGANENIAWGASNLPADCQDMVIEHLNPDDSNQYEVDGEWVDFEVTIDDLVYKDSTGETRTYALKIYTSRHGPVIAQGIETYTALKWTGIDPSDDVTGYRKAMAASTIEEFYEAFREYHSPAQNLCVVENGLDGRIAQIFIGDIPIRNGYDGRSPVDGRDSSLDWVGFIPYDDLPHRIDPEEGYIAHANNIPLDAIEDDGSRPLGYSFTANNRVSRIIEMVNSNPDGLTFEDMRGFQMDDLDMPARFFIPKLLDALGGNFTEANPEISGYIELIAEWDYHLSKDSIAATIYQVWILKLIQNCINNRLPSGVTGYIAYEDRWIQILEDYLEGETELDWLEPDNEYEIHNRMGAAFLDAITELQSTFGFDSSFWKWGDVNEAIFPHPSGEANLIGAGSHRWGGGRYTVRVGHYSLYSGPPFVNDFGAVFRGVVASTEGSWRIGAVLPPGQGGITFAPHGSDQMELWLNGELRDVSYGITDAETRQRVRLVPVSEIDSN